MIPKRLQCYNTARVECCGGTNFKPSVQCCSACLLCASVHFSLHSQHNQITCIHASDLEAPSNRQAVCLQKMPSLEACGICILLYDGEGFSFILYFIQNIIKSLLQVCPVDKRQATHNQQCRVCTCYVSNLHIAQYTASRVSQKYL